jgi:F0F1-type ATP synthase epsilon subunit
MAVTGGFVEVNKKDNVTTVAILADFAEHVAEISEAEITKAKARSEELRKQAENNEIIDFEHFESELERSLNRVKIADKWRTRKYRK